MKVGDAVSFTKTHVDYLHSIGRWPTEHVEGFTSPQPVHHLRVEGIVTECDDELALVSWAAPTMITWTPIETTYTRHFIDNLIVRS